MVNVENFTTKGCLRACNKRKSLHARARHKTTIRIRRRTTKTQKWMWLPTWFLTSSIRGCQTHASFLEKNIPEQSQLQSGADRSLERSEQEPWSRGSERRDVRVSLQANNTQGNERHSATKRPPDDSAYCLLASPGWVHQSPSETWECWSVWAEL